MKREHSFDAYEPYTTMPRGFRFFEQFFWGLIFAVVPLALLVQTLLPAVHRSVYQLTDPTLLDQLSIESIIGWLFIMLMAVWASGSLHWPVFQQRWGEGMK